MIDNNLDIQKYFKENSYVVIRKFITPEIALLFYQYCLTHTASVDLKMSHYRQHYHPAWDGEFGDKQAPGAYSKYGDPLMDTFLVLNLQRIEEFVGIKLIPNYSYWRLYQKGNDLKKHIDRDSCEISCTICLGYNTSNVDSSNYPDYNWPMWVENKNDQKDIPIQLQPGDLIVYKGCDLYHWRDEFLGLNHAQLFLHYNDADGPYQIKLDGRPILGVPKNCV